MAFDPNKHRKTQEKLATLQNTKQLVWKIDKPKKKDYVRIYGNSLDDLHVVNCFDQRDGGGEEKLWLIQGKDDKEEDKILAALNPEDILRVIVVPVFVRANKQTYIWLAKQGKANLDEPHPVHLQIRDCIQTAQKKWCKIFWEKSSKQYQCTPPQNAEIFGDVDWPSEDEILQHLEKSFNDRIIDTADHDVVKRTLGLVI
jgi:hypothetical protein|tara:strand:+ start:1271 stop:1870 length:600 start_codon:yes stop_codon:yes gene_type:complete